jgi:hypothetical protein
MPGCLQPQHPFVMSRPLIAPRVRALDAAVEIVREREHSSNCRPITSLIGVVAAITMRREEAYRRFHSGGDTGQVQCVFVEGKDSEKFLTRTVTSQRWI